MIYERTNYAGFHGLPFNYARRRRTTTLPLPHRPACGRHHPGPGLRCLARRTRVAPADQVLFGFVKRLRQLVGVQFSQRRGIVRRR